MRIGDIYKASTLRLKTLNHTNTDNMCVHRNRDYPSHINTVYNDAKDRVFSGRTHSGMRFFRKLYEIGLFSSVKLAKCNSFLCAFEKILK